MSQEPKPKFEYQKLQDERNIYSNYKSWLSNASVDSADIIENFPLYTGELSLIRYLSLYKLYEKVTGLAGHVAEVGVGKGPSLFFFAKLVRSFESRNLTMVHGFDWFRGSSPTAAEKFIKAGDYLCEQGYLEKLLELQGLTDICKLHLVDLSMDLPKFFIDNSHLLFKLVFFDIGIHGVLAPSVENFLPRLVKGGVAIFDHFSHEFAPGESKLMIEMLNDYKFEQVQNGWMPCAYFVKT
jgi:hypothetical protein